MRARDLAREAPRLRPDDPAVDAVRLLASGGLPGVVVSDGDSYVVVPASQVLRAALPRYVLEDPSLARVWDEASADALAARLDDRRVADLVAALDRDRDAPEPAVDADATLVEIAAVMAAGHVPLVAVVDHGRYRGVVSVADVVARLLP